MTNMSDLTWDMAGEILSRVRLTSLRSVGSTCKTWNALSKSAARRRYFLGFMMMDSKVCSLSVDFQRIRNDADFVGPSIKQVRILDQVEISKIFHCGGLLLCVSKSLNSLLVWNPCLGHTRSIRPRNHFSRLDRYALGYDKNRNHKILRFMDDYVINDDKGVFAYQIYDLTSNSWRVLDMTPDWDIKPYQRGVSLHGNTYFFAQEKITVADGKIPQPTEEIEDFLLCFDFETESFGPRLPLPFHSYAGETVALSCVIEEQLSVLYQGMKSFEIMEIWVTTKIDPIAVSWSMFLRVDMKPLTGFQFNVKAGSFFINEEKKVAVVFDLDGYEKTETCRYQTAHIIGQDGYFKSVNIGEAQKSIDKFGYCVPLVCSSPYVPSLVQLQKINQTGKRKERDY